MGEDHVCHVSTVILLTRSDKQADRVEISPEQLGAASTEAERLAVEFGRPMRVVGWYHSHPHITVWPSHVDVRTQADYQLLDDGFVGVIISAFNQDKQTKLSKIQITCFQSTNLNPEGVPSQYVKRDIPVHIVPTPCIRRPNLDCLARLPDLLTQEETELYEQIASGGDASNLVTKIHNASVYSRSLCHVLEVLSGPLAQTLEDRLRQNERDIAQLQKEKQRLHELLKPVNGQSTSV